MPERKDDENIFIETLEWICKKLEKDCESIYKLNLVDELEKIKS